MRTNRTPEALERADVRRCGTLWYATSEEGTSIPATPGARVRTAQAGDAAALRAAMVAVNADQPELAEVRLRGKRLGYLAEALEPAQGIAASEVLSYGWIARAGDKVNDLGFPLALPPSEGWIYDCATVPDARGRGLYVALLMTMRAEFQRYGLERGWIGTAPANWASQRGIAHAGFQKVADMDWRGTTVVVYGVPGIPESVLRVMANVTDDADARILPDAGIPWIDAILATRDGARLATEPGGLRRFRIAYGEQLHWSLRAVAPGEEQSITLRTSGNEERVPMTASLAQYDAAMERLAPGLPRLDDAA